ncbi:MAG: FtsH-binding integral membrane protein [Patiriisocius sp.]|jgi:FtsH-binding integral membrane protein
MDSLDSQYVMLNRADAITRVDFIKRTYKHVAGSVLVFIVLEAFLLSMPGVENLINLMIGGRFSWLVVLGIFYLATNYAEKMSVQSHDIKKQYMGLGLTIVAYAVIFLPIIFIAMNMTGDTYLIRQAGIVTLALFGGLTLVVFTTKTDFSFLRAAISMGSMIAMGLIIGGMIFGFTLGLWFSVGMVVLAAGAILYQTSNIAHKYSTDQHVSAALGLFASLMLLFFYILNIFMSRD